MSEWWTYRPSDFLMFAPRIYWRLFESINEAYWPLHLALLAAGVAWLARPRGGLAARLALGVAALAWALVAWAFQHQRFAPIQWVADGYAVLFAAQAVLLLGLAATGSSLELASDRRRRGAGLALFAWALLAHPALAWAWGRPWIQAEVPGLAPDPTAIASLGLLLTLQGESALTRRLHAAAWIAPIAWCLASAATLATMGSGQAWVMLMVPVLALLASRIGLR